MIDFLDLINVVKEAGDKTKEFFGHSVMERSKENDDLVTNADLYVDEYIFNYINSNFPDHGFDSEEREMIRPEAEYIWILDPIDGTKYFQQSIPLYSIALALQFKQKLVQGIVYNPQVNEFFYASSLNQDGAKKNGLSIYCSNDKPFEELSIIMELPNRNNSDESIKNALAIMEALMQKVKRVRVFGVGAIS